MKKQEYVLGFLFDYRDIGNITTPKYVALICKNKPEWQAGKFNGIGGKIEQGENAYDAMAREFKEETGVDTWVNRRECWKKFAEMHSLTWKVHCFAAWGDPYACKTTTDEEVRAIYLGELHGVPMVENLEWLIKMAIDHLVDGRPEFANIQYPS